MGSFDSNLKKAYLVDLWEGVKAQSIADVSTLLEGITQKIRDFVALTSAGSPISSSSIGANATTFDTRATTPDDHASLWMEMLDRYTWAAAGGSGAAAASTDDATIYARMMADMALMPSSNICRHYIHDFSYAR